MPLQLFLRRRLQSGIESRPDPQRLVVEAVAELLLQLAPHLLHEIGRDAVFARSRARLSHDPERRLARRSRLIGDDPLLLRHQAQDQIAALAGLPWVAPRVIEAGRFRQPGQERSLGQREPARGHSEIVAGGRLDAARAVAEVDVVQIQLEDLVLAEPVLDLVGHPDLEQLAAERALAGGDALRKGVARELHRQRARSFFVTPGLQVREQGADDPAQVDGAVLVEALVLGGEEGLRHVARKRPQRHDLARHGSEVGELAAAPVEQDRRTSWLVRREAPDVGAAGDAAAPPGGAHEHERAGRAGQRDPEPRRPPAPELRQQRHEAGTRVDGVHHLPTSKALANSRAGEPRPLPTR